MGNEERDLGGRWTPFLIWLLLVASLVPWRNGVFYDGGLDPVVVGKAILQVCVLVMAGRLFLLHESSHRAVAGAPVVLFVFFAAVTCVGAMASGDQVASLVLAVQMLITGATVLAMVRVFPTEQLMAPMLGALGSVGVVAAISGLGAWGSTGRLGGEFPPLSPNAVAMLVGLPAIALVYDIVNGRGRMWKYCVLPVLFAILVATESRTSLGGFAVGVVIVLVRVRWLPRGVAAAMIAAIPIGFVILTYTPIIGDLLHHSNGASIATLNSRTIAWQAVLATPIDSWQYWIGSGLSVRTVAVPGQYWERQVLDSSWISALAQGGVIGFWILAAIAGLALWCGLRSMRWNSLLTAILVFVLIRSVLENGLTEASVAFVVFFTISLVVNRPRGSAVDPSGPREGEPRTHRHVSIYPVKAPR